MPLHVSSTYAHRQEAKIVLYNLWYHHTYRWPSRAQVERGVFSQPVHGTATYMCDDTRGCIVQFWPPDDEHVCSKHVEAWNKLIIKFSVSSWLILTLWRRNYFFLILVHPVYKMLIIQEPNKLALWNKLQFEEKKRRV